MHCPLQQNGSLTQGSPCPGVYTHTHTHAHSHSRTQTETDTESYDWNAKFASPGRSTLPEMRTAPHCSGKLTQGWRRVGGATSRDDFRSSSRLTGGGRRKPCTHSLTSGVDSRRSSNVYAKAKGHELVSRHPAPAPRENHWATRLQGSYSASLFGKFLLRQLGGGSR